METFCRVLCPCPVHPADEPDLRPFPCFIRVIREIRGTNGRVQKPPPVIHDESALRALRDRASGNARRVEYSGSPRPVQYDSRWKARECSSFERLIRWASAIVGTTPPAGHPRAISPL